MTQNDQFVPPQGSKGDPPDGSKEDLEAHPWKKEKKQSKWKSFGKGLAEFIAQVLVSKSR